MGIEARLTKEYDERGRLARPKDGYAKWTAKYDERGNRTEEAYFDESGPAHPAQGRLRPVDRQVRRAGQPDRGGLLRRAGPAHPAQGRLHQADEGVRWGGGPPQHHVLRHRRRSDHDAPDGRRRSIRAVRRRQSASNRETPSSAMTARTGSTSATFIRAVQAPGEGTRELRILRRGEVLTFQVQPGKLGIHLVDRAVQGEKTPSP